MKIDNRFHQKRKESIRVTSHNYDRLSRWYDLLSARSERRAQSAGLYFLDVQEGDLVLEIGFGTGQSLLELAQAVGQSGRVWGIDISKGMVSRAREKIGKNALTRKITLVRGSATNLPFASSLFRAIYMSFTLELFDTEDITRVLLECRRVLTDGGLVGVVALAKKDDPGIPTRMYEWAHKKYPTLIDCRPINAQMFMSSAGFWVKGASEMSVWGIPVWIVLGIKK